MKRWSVMILAAVAACAGALNAYEPTPVERVVHVNHCLVSLIDEVTIAAQAAGVVGQTPIRDGDDVAAGAVLMQLDDRKPQADLQSAEIRRLQAAEEAANRSKLQVAQSSFKVAETEYDNALKVNEQVPGAISQMELDRRRLEVEKARASVELAELERKSADWVVQLRSAEQDIAETQIAQSRLVSPIAGQVVELKKKVGEWVSPGEPIARIVRMDRVRVDGHVSVNDCSPRELIGRTVKIQIRTDRGLQETAEGKIVFVDPRVLPGGKLQVRAEVANQRQEGRWVLLPGMTGAMSVDLRPEEIADGTSDAHAG